ncbi:hypothetical protein ACO7_360049 [Thiomonas arsenitoxydans]|nr:hypothetical protein ACO7_360049 [Thiomonas arsenitoxydans]
MKNTSKKIPKTTSAVWIMMLDPLLHFLVGSTIFRYHLCPSWPTSVRLGVIKPLVQKRKNGGQV